MKYTNLLEHKFSERDLFLFPRNGVSLGMAFENISRGSGMAYFPAISLSFKESVAFNFGSRPLRYPLTVILAKLWKDCSKSDVRMQNVLFFSHVVPTFSWLSLTESVT